MDWMKRLWEYFCGPINVTWDSFSCYVCKGKQGKDSTGDNKAIDGITKESPFEAKYVDRDKIIESEELIEKLLASGTGEACRLQERKSSTSNDFFKIRTFELKPEVPAEAGAEVGGNSGGGQGGGSNTEN